MKRAAAVVAVGAVAGLAISGCGGGSSNNNSQSTSKASTAQTTTQTSTTPVGVESEQAQNGLASVPTEKGASQKGTGGDWPAFGGTEFNQRYSTLKQINKHNVSDLQMAWHIHLNDPDSAKVGVSQQGSGLEANGVYYISTGCDDVFAVNAATGQSIWHYKSGIPTGGANKAQSTKKGKKKSKNTKTPLKNTKAAVIPCQVNRGMVMGGGNVYIAQLDGKVVALNQRTGKVAWKAQMSNSAKGYYQDTAPAYVNGMIITSPAGGESGTRGYVDAYDAKTGKRQWRFYTVPQQGEPGYDSWGGAKTQYGGGNVWAHPVVDKKLGLVYVATGNASPYSRRPAGNDLYTSSLVALDLKTGKMKWYYQLVHHDMWDLDISADSPLLFNTTIDGKKRYGIAEPTKMGYNFLLDRITGKPLVPTPETPAPQDPARPDASPTQPIPSGDPFAPVCATKAGWLAAGGSDPSDGPDGKPIEFGCNYEPVVADHYTVPGWHDTADWPPTSFSPQTNTEFVCSTNNRGDAYKESDAKSTLTPGVGYTGNVSLVAGDWVKQKIGMVTAIDVSDNGMAWQTRLPDKNGCYAGTAVTAGGVVFAGEFSGHEVALDAKTGDILWQSPQLDASVFGPPIVYNHKGKEYVAFLVGGASISAASKHGNSVYAFALP